MASNETLAKTARAEANRRAAAIPAALRAGQLTQFQADQDIVIWDAIAAQFDRTGFLPLTYLWGPATAATARAARAALRAHEQSSTPQTAARAHALIELARAISVQAQARGITPAATSHEANAS